MAETIILAEALQTVRLEVTSPTRLQISASQPGPSGKDGIDSRFVSYSAAIALGGNRIVCLDASNQAIYADKDTLLHKDIVLGITTGAVGSGSLVVIQIFGVMTEPSWSWIPEDTLYLDNNGLITNVSPVTGFSLVIGFAISATQIFINIKQPIILT